MPEPQESGLTRELGARDLTLFAIACIVGTRWIASAAHAGPGAILLWLLAAAFFAIPLAISVAILTARQPRSGGMYLWTSADFGSWHGFLCFAMYWMSSVIWYPSAAIFYVSMAAASLRPSWAAFAQSRVALMAGSLFAIWIALGTNIAGVKIGKWTENVGAIANWVLGVLLSSVAFLVCMKRGSATSFHLLPDMNWDTVSFWATIALATAGMELAGMMGGEIRDPQRSITRAAVVASAFATLFYASSTAALLILLRPEDISELSGLAQAGAQAGRVLGQSWFSPLIGATVLASAIGQIGGLGASVSRLPFAAGVDRLLPAAFARIHPRWGTPHISTLWFGGLASFFLIGMQFGDSARAGYQTLVSLCVLVSFIPYLYIFASGWKAGKRWSAAIGSSMTLLAISCSLVPSGQIHSVWVFEGKLAASTLAIIAAARLLYTRAKNMADAARV